MKKYNQEKYKYNMEKICASNIPFIAATPAVILFNVKIDGKDRKANYYPTTGRFLVFKAGINKVTPIEEALQWVRQHTANE